MTDNNTATISLEELLEPLRIHIEALSEAAGVPLNILTSLLHLEQSITEDTAASLYSYFGMSEDFWLGLNVQKGLMPAVH